MSGCLIGRRGVRALYEQDNNTERSPSYPPLPLFSCFISDTVLQIVQIRVPKRVNIGIVGNEQTLVQLPAFRSWPIIYSTVKTRHS